MKQSRLMSLVEAIANVAVGYGVAVMTQFLVFPAFGLQITRAENLKLAAAFTFISIVRSFLLRRLFEAIRADKNERQTAALVGRRCQITVVLRRQFCKPAHAPRPFQR